MYAVFLFDYLLVRLKFLGEGKKVTWLARGLDLTWHILWLELTWPSKNDWATCLSFLSIVLLHGYTESISTLSIEISLFSQVCFFSISFAQVQWLSIRVGLLPKCRWPTIHSFNATCVDTRMEDWCCYSVIMQLTLRLLFGHTVRLKN